MWCLVFTGVIVDGKGFLRPANLRFEFKTQVACLDTLRVERQHFIAGKWMDLDVPGTRPTMLKLESLTCEETR
jgi:hypothetical protein